MRLSLTLWLLAACTTDQPVCDSSCDSATELACAALDTTWSLEDIPAGGECVAAPAPADLVGAPRIAVAVYHFNIQYVAGGLRGFLGNPPEYDLDEVQTEDRIVRVGLEPVLDLYLAHPSFKADIELQAYMVEVIAQRHPDVLAKMRVLAERGQVDFDSLHYSDQLYVAYPLNDLERSLALTAAVFERVCLPRGRAVFAQEGQFARGQLPLAAAHGFTASILPKNLFEYQFGEPATVLYEDPSAPGHSVLLGGKGFTSEGFELRWTFMNDGEIAFTENQLNPYFGLDYQLDEDRIAAHAAELAAMETEGFVHATVAEAAAAMRARGIAPAPLPAVLDGTWQPRDTRNVGRWMGGAGLFRPQESDSGTLAAVWRARRAASLASANGGSERGIAAAWRELMLAEVSDATGWNPFVNEVQYARGHAALAEQHARDAMTCAGVAADAPSGDGCDQPSTRTLADLGLELVIPTRAHTVAIDACARAGLTRVTVSMDALAEREPELVDPTPEQALDREMELRATRSGPTVALVPARYVDSRTADLASYVEEIALDAYVFERIAVPLPLGLVGLGGDRWLIVDQGTMRLAATVARVEPDRGVVRFVDETVSRAEPSVRVFYVLEGADAAGAVAEALSRL